jgi:RNA polymerase sigma-B factor
VSAGSAKQPPKRNPQALFLRYRREGDNAAREALIEHYLPLARSVANRYRHTPQPTEDLFQVASMALIKAVDGFDPDRGLAFSSYAVPTIIGELKRHFRDTVWALHLPRALKERVLLVERTERELSASLGRAPTVDDLAAATKLSTEEVLDAIEARSAHDAESIDSTADDDQRATLAETIGGEDERLGLVEDRSALSSAMQHLSERDLEILNLRFVQGLTQSDIAERIGVSQMQISRLLRRALAQLRERIETESGER